MFMSENESEKNENSTKSNARSSSLFALIIDANEYENKNRHLMKTSILKSLEFHRNLSSHEIEDFAKQKTKTMTKFRSQ